MTPDLGADYNDTLVDQFDQQSRQLLTHDISITILSLTMVTALGGNLVMAFVIIRSTTRRLGPVHILMLHTCVADIAFALCCVLPQIARMLTFPHFYGNDALCKALSVIQVVPMFASSYLLMAISIDRYIAICRPIRAMHWKYKRVFLLAASAWAVSILFSTPQSLVFRYGHVDDQIDGMYHVETCWAKFRSRELEIGYMVWFSVAVWLIPSIAVGTLYTMVCLAVFNSSRVLQTTDSAMHHSTINNIRNDAVSANARWSESLRSVSVVRPPPNRINRHKIKTVKLTLTIVVCNFVLWAPFCITNFISAIISENAIDQNVAGLIVLVGNLNSCVNPWIYLAFNCKQLSSTQRSRPTTRPRSVTQYRAVPVALTVHTVLRRRSSGESLNSYTACTET